MPGDYDELTRSSQDRRRYFTRAWIRSMLQGREGLGDTFWVGNFGMLLIIVPLAALVPVLLSGVGMGPGLLIPLQGLFLALVGLYFVGLGRAVFIVARRTPQAGPWRWVGLAYTLAQAALCLVGAMAFLTGSA
jgi:hypothetical protein